MRARGATFVEVMVLLAFVLGGVAGAVFLFSGGLQSGAQCEATFIARLGVTSCKGTGPLAAAAAPATGAAPTANGGAAAMTCDKYGCAPRSGNCFVAGTLVAVPGGHRPIESLAPGDTVLALDTSSDDASAASPAARRVVATKRTEHRAVVAIELVAPTAREIVHTTTEHPFFVEGRGWTTASMLSPDDPLVSPHGTVRVGAVAELASDATVYNLEVEDLHTYLVGASETLVHNDCGDPRAEVDIQEPRLKPTSDGKGFVLQRRFITGGDKIIGEPTNTVGSVQDASREARAAEAMAKRPDITKVYLGKEADLYLRKLAAERGTPFPAGEQQMPDVVGVKKDGTLVLGEGKGANVAHAGDQFGNVGKHVGAAKVAEQWVFPPSEPRDYKLGKGGYLEELVKTIEKGEKVPKAELDKLRRAGVMIETRPRPDGGTDFVRLWKPNGVKVQAEILSPLPPKATTVAGGAEVTAPKPTPLTLPKPQQVSPSAPETAPAKPTVVAETPAVRAPAAGATEPTPIPGKPGTPTTGAQIKGQVAGGGVALLGTVSGKIVEHETGSKTAGVVTNIGVTGTGTVIVAKAAGQGLTKTVAGASGAALVGWGARAGTEYVTGSQTAGDLAGFGAAAGTGAAFGGPIGAVGGVVIHGASELASSGIDYYYAKRAGEALEERRKILVIHGAFVRARGRAPNDRELAHFMHFMGKGWDADFVMMMNHQHPEAAELRAKILKHHLNREPTAGELQAAANFTKGGGWVSELEKRVIEIKVSYAYILARAPDEAGMKSWLDYLADDPTATVQEMRKRIAESPEATALVKRIYETHLGRAPTPEEAKAARDKLASGTSARDVETEVMKRAAPPAK
ncbi:MAG: Hint domain-containing protein [Deltaproteobacteria bacterium]|nr:Hint domain-containing protein [Deltaproteobacteria bacterium]